MFSVFESSSRSRTPFSSIATFSSIVPNVCVVRVDLRLGLGGEADHLRVAAALEVEDAAVAPAVLVVADQRALGVGRERRLAGAREAEEDRDVAVVADVRRAVHREDALERQPVVHHREDRLLDLAGVERAADQQLGAAGMQHDERAGARAVLVRVGLEVGRVQHERLAARTRLSSLGGEVDEHRLREERVVRVRGDDAHADPVRRVGAGEGVDDVERVGRAEVRGDLLAQAVEVLLRERLVDLAPPDPVLGAGLARRRTCPSASGPCARRCRRRAGRPRRDARRRAAARACRAATSSGCGTTT